MGNVFSLQRSRALGVVLSLAIVCFLGYGCGGSSSGGGAVGTAISGSLTTPGSGSLPAGVGVGPNADPTADAGVPGATIEAKDGDGNVVASTTTAADGSYTIRVPDGTYQIGVSLGTIDFFVPSTKSVIVQGSNVQGLTTDGSNDVLDFGVPEPTGTDMSGQVQGTGGSAVTVEIIDADGIVRYTTVTDASGNYTITDILPEGNYTVRVATDTLPTGTAAPTPQNISVADGTADLNVNYDLPTATQMNGLISTTGGVAPLASLSPSGDLQPAFLPTAELTVTDEAEVIVIEVGFGEIGRFPILTDGSFALDVRDGSYILEFRGLGNDVVAPAPIRITVKGGDIYTDGSDTPLDASVDTLGSTAHDVSATLTGTVTLDGTGVETIVLAQDPVTGGVVASAKTDSTGAFELPLADGSYDIILEPDFLPTGVLPPAAIRVAVESGDDPANPFKEDNGTADDGVVDFPLSRANVALSGTITDSAPAGISSIKVLAFKGDDIVARAESDSDGVFTLDLPLGTVDIRLAASSVPTSFIVPDELRLDIASDGTDITITGDSGVITALSYVLEDAGLPNLTGTVVFDFDNDMSIDTDNTDGAHEFVGCRVVVADSNGEEILFEQPSNPFDGSFTFTLPNGTYVIGLDPQGLPPGTAAPPRQKFTVGTDGITMADGTLTPTVSLPATMGFELVARAATLTGAVTINSRGTSVALNLVDLAT
ncbi:MAG: carboxypeptidase regulatory-like domain-containing protein, partial [Planctomycetota bacterium]